MPAAWAGLAVGVGSQIAGALGGGGAQSSAISAGQAQANAAAQAAIATGTTNYAGDQGNAAPFLQQGQNALLQYANLTGVNGQPAANAAMSTFQSSPGYGYQVQQGLKAVDNGAASQGLLRSGATLKAEQTLGSNLANQNFTNYMGQLNSLAGFGLQGASLDNQSTSTFDNLLNSQTNSIAGTDTSAAGAQAGISGNTANTLANAAGGLVKNGLYAYGMSGNGGITNSGNTSTDSAGNVGSYGSGSVSI